MNERPRSWPKSIIFSDHRVDYGANYYGRTNNIEVITDAYLIYKILNKKRLKKTLSSEKDSIKSPKLHLESIFSTP